MKQVTITIKKKDVMDEVAKATSYTGAKAVGDPKAYDRIFTTDEDRQALERFWCESCGVVTQQLKGFLLGVSGGQPTSNATLVADYVANLEMSEAYDDNLTESITMSLSSYCVNSITAKWYMYTNKGESEAYMAVAQASLEDAAQKLWYRKRPQRHR